jgi:signal transduction histidine kinase
LARAFDQMRQSLKQTQAELLRSERLATIGHMASSIIHDLRNPLATITTAAEVLSGNNLSPERRQVLIESQLRAAQRMNDMLKELLEFSRGSYQLAVERHSLAQLIERALREWSAAAVQAGIMVESCIPADLFVKADAERLRRVFENLLFNSIQAMPDGCKITLRAAAHGTYVRLDMIDTGPGVPAQIRERLFEPFVSHAKQGGLGLGLAIAKKIVEAHGGTIGLEQAAGQGADFYLELPLDTGGGDGAEDPTG